LGDIQSCWSEAVGAVIAAQATPTSDRGGVVTVACSASVWAQELDLMGPEIVRRLNELIGSDYVRGLRCVATGAER
jgi:predicted nucleic acid-binding Zn ribbon protein